MENVCAISHASDIDGVGSAALIRMKYGVPLKRLFFTDYSKESLDYVDSKLKPLYRSGITLFITDLGTNESLVKKYKSIIDAVRKGAGRVIWFDHHPWPAQAIRELTPLCDVAIIGENEKYCATEIVYRELGFRNRFAKEFVKLVHHSDFNITPRSGKNYETVGTYALSITSYGILKSRDRMTAKLRHLAGVISSGKFYDGRVRQDALRFKRLNDRRIKRMVASMLLYPRAAIGFSSYVQSTAGCVLLMKSSGKEIGIYINASNMRGHIRCENRDISALARELGGGGHPHASGFNVDRRFGSLRTAAQRRELADFIQEKIERFVK